MPPEHHAPERVRPRRSHRLPGGTAGALAVAAVLAITPAAAQATVTPRSAPLNTPSGLSAFDQVNETTGSLRVDTSRAYEGASSAHAVYNGGGSNGFARGIFNVGWATGDDVHFGGAFFLPTGFKSKIQSETDLMRYDNYGTSSTVDYGGIGILASDRKAHLFKVGGYVTGSSGSGSEDQNVAPAFDLPEGRWFWMEVHQRLSTSNGSAVNEVFIDGAKVSSSTSANTFGRGVSRLRYGMVAIGEGKQTNPLDLWFDRATVSTSTIGPLGGVPTPSPTPTTPTPPTTGSSAGGSTSTGTVRRQPRRLHVRRATIRGHRLVFSVTANGRPVRPSYRFAGARRYRPYRGAVRLTAAQLRRVDVAVRSGHAVIRLVVRRGRVSVR